MELKEMEKRLLFQVDGDYQSFVKLPRSATSIKTLSIALYKVTPP